MAVAIPAGLSLNLLRSGASILPPKSVLVSDMEIGQKTRPLGQGHPEEFTGRFRIGDADYVTFRDWVANDLKGGSLRFDWSHPLLGTPVEALFITREGRAYTISEVRGFNYYVDVSLRVF